jgi:ferritin-like metal-binding protein YciE
MSKMKTLHDGLVDSLKDIYSAETQLLKAMPKMERKATNEQLQELFASHLTETEAQVERLQDVSDLIGKRLTGKTCKAMKGLIEEGSEALELESDNEALIDSMIASAALRVECYEIAAYESAIGMATEVGLDEIVELLQESLAEEKESYSKLTKLCKKELFPDAYLEEEDEDEATGRSARRVAPKSQRQGSSASMRASGAAKLASLLTMSAALVLPLSYASADDAAGYGSRDSRERNVEASQYKTDNTGRNVRDANRMSKTADSQQLSGKDNNVLADIRRRIVANDDISTYGKNIKIVVENGTVTLRGPVRSADERSRIERVVNEAASGYTIVNQLEVERS